MRLNLKTYLPDGKVDSTRFGSMKSLLINGNPAFLRRSSSKCASRKAHSLALGLNWLNAK
jgi:hypothetical protein